MAVRVRLTRVGSKKNPVWRVVVADQRSPRDGRIIEQIGHYDARPHPSRIVIDHDRLEHWLARGAEPTNTVRKLMRAPNTPAPVAMAEPAAAQETEVEAEADGAVAVATEPEGAAESEVAAEDAAAEDAAAEPEPASGDEPPADTADEPS